MLLIAFSPQKNQHLIFRYVNNISESQLQGWNDDNELYNNNLLRIIIKNNNINGDYRLIIKSNDKGKLIDKNYFFDSNFWKNYKTDFQVNSEFNDME